MTDRWVRERKEEAFYRRAHREGYRARSAYKLVEIQKRFRVLRRGDTVVDLGASPGGWSQVALEAVGPQGRVYGVDLDRVAPLPGATFLLGDLTQPETVSRLRQVMSAGDGRPVANTVLSDMSPNLSGQYTRDQAESAFLCWSALGFAEQVLDRGGAFVCKIFEGTDYPDFLAALRERFESVKPHRPQATRRHSSEVYLVAKGFRGARPAGADAD